MVQKSSINAVALDVATGKKQYVKPQMEVIDLDEQPKLLSGSNSARFHDIDRDEEEW